MNSVERVLQRWRIAKARPYITHGARVLDIGCFDGALFKRLKSHIGEGIGIDPGLDGSVEMDYCRLIAGEFPRDLPDDRPFDVITMLAVLEHVPPDCQPRLAEACTRFLKDGGYLVITVPAPAVDPILRVLKSLRIIDGTFVEQHYGFDAAQTPELFALPGLKLVTARKFQLGLNNLFVLTKIGTPGS